MTKSIASIGFRTKTAKAIAVALTDRGSPEFVQRWNLELYDRDVPETSGPHHQVMEVPWPEAQVAVRRYEKLIEDVTTERLRALLQDLRSRAFHVRSVGVVGSSDRRLEKLGNRHIRAHAAEGILFRRAVEIAAKRCKLPCRQFSDRGFEERAMQELQCTSQEIKSVMGTVGRSAGRPWRADERAAAMAAWIVLGQAASYA
ncbi:MAG: hypothetical protein ACXW2F_04650 [Thermoanaerobaculia bacterium]